ncbi:hypothetical protein QTP70_007292 [Hemibagrus guttatus]|uniref:ribonuclease H n=1 Tax=Hemibagrus guttatus TaxID=175788 RepID=A0AAE0R405_9TELE|nr:hypothetical protein QTP70_007292 [Hemibagrus guttatus]
MERRKVDILCVQESRWKGSKARSIGAGFKLFYYGVDSKRNGVGVVLKEEFVRNVLEVKRVSDRVMSLKLEIEGVMLNVVSGYAPQVGCELEEKERFWSELDEVMESIPTGERVVIGADFNGHVGEGNTGDEEVMGKFGVKERNLEGQMVVDFAKRMDMGVVNTYFQKREEHRVTYKSGGRSTQVDYILCRRGNLKEISDCKVVVGESVARQHRMVVCRMTLMVCKKKRSEIEKKTKWWKLKKEECCEEFRQKLRQALGGQVVLPDDWETTAEVIRETGRKVLGVSSGRRKEDKETWWWNEEVQDSIQRKRLAKKKWDMDRTEENRQEYKELQRRVKREVSKAKQKAYDELYTRLDTREGEKDLYRLARQRDRDGKDVQQVRVIKDRDGRVLTSEESVQRRWKEYFEELMNEENEREKRVEGVNSVEQKGDKIRKDEVRKALKRMKSGKAVGPDDIPVEVWKCLGEAAVEFLASLFNRVLESERMPEEWRRSVLVPIFKNKGDVQSCSNYRGIKLMSHTMKVWERVVEARLRKVVEICEQQYGFMPRKSTTDAIFALRILMEKYRDGQKELHCVFVDLEKAYDRVPREELWYCMKKSGVAEKYVRVVQDMYERSRTVVRCAVVMDQLSEEVRQESPWTMMFADDIVICSESREQVEENLERWRFALERRGMKVSRSKTEYMCVNEREGSGTVRLQGEEVKKVQEFKYLGSTVQSNGECGKEVKKRVQAGWNGWRKVSGVLCDQKISARIKGKVYRTVVRPAMLYGLETVSLRKRQESELEVAELKMLRFSLGVTRLDRIRNEYIRGTAHVGRLGDKVREARLRWFGHVQRRDNTSASMNQRTHLGTTYLDIAKGAVETFLKLRSRDPASRGDRYMLVSFEEATAGIKAGWKESHAIFMTELRNLQAFGLTTFGQSLRIAFDLLNLNRLVSGIDNYGQGRNPFFLEPAIIVAITDGCKLSSTSGVQDEVRCDLLGRSYSVFSQRMLNQCLESLVQKIQSGVVINFEKTGPDPAEDGSSEVKSGPQPWHSCHKLIYVRPNPKTGVPVGHWPIPESFWPDQNSPTLPPRMAHPQVRFSCLEAEPMVVDKVPFDKYELEPSPLTQYILERKSPQTCWQVFVSNSAKYGELGQPFGYLKASTALSCVNLFVMPYNYPVVLPLLDDLIRVHKFKPTPKWRQAFESYLKTMPLYYITPLRKALRMMGAPNLLAESMEYGLSYSVASYLKKLSQQAKVEADRVCALVGKKTGPDVGIKLRSRSFGVSLAHRKDFAQLLQGIMGDGPLDINPKEFSGFQLAVLNKALKPQGLRNPYDIPRIQLLDQLSRMRRNLLNTSMCVLKGQDQDQLHSVPIAQMGNYQDFLKLVPTPLREADPDQPKRLHTFGNPFKLDKKAMMVDEADEFVTGTQGKGKRPIDTSTPTGAPKRRRCMSPLLRLGRAYTPPNKTPPRVLAPDANHVGHLETERAPVLNHMGHLNLEQVPDSNHVGHVELDRAPDSNHVSCLDLEQPQELPLLPPILHENHLEEEEEAEQKNAGGNPDEEELKRKRREEGRELNTELRVLITREIRKPGRRYERIFYLLKQIQGSLETRLVFLQNIIKEAARFKKRVLIEQLENFLEEIHLRANSMNHLDGF